MGFGLSGAFIENFISARSLDTFLDRKNLLLAVFGLDRFRFATDCERFELVGVFKPTTEKLDLLTF